ncbi:Glycosyltransferase involved in cell wall bisynthesis [Bacteroides luti]|uniref:Glycosyltransferase involved in cell wall bisynthesis n=1 Tax=Bacteroides luti TaxID=1297750 RepID=A0A1M5BGB6_9BACE|nr:glycosyltransferase family 4 protein [Bacteroides luti]SHF41584.1 Glycosyltransferase involved in cell wall bisynthesis [Bacteroides luti]
MATKIVYIIGGIWNGSGMERVLTMKANYMADVAGYDVHVLLTEDGEGPSYFPLSEKIHLHNVHVNFDILYTLPIYKRVFAYLWKQRLYKQRLTDFLIKLKPDITVTAMRREINFINDIQDGSKKVGEIHFTRIGYREVNFKFLPNFVNKGISRLWINNLLKEVKRLSAFVVLSEEDKLNWPKLKNIQVIYNPISINTNIYSYCHSKKVIAVGRYTYQKGFDLLTDAWKIVTEKHPDWVLNIYGGGDADQYRELAIKKGISKTFICNGPTHNIIDKYLESSIFVLSSRYEGFGLVIAEAMACGLPIVSFACPCGPQDIISNEEDGFLVENGNISLLAKKIVYLIENENKRVEMGRKAIESVNRFKMENIGTQWVKLFESVIKE